MSEERDLEKELKEEKDRYERQNQEAYDEVTKGNEELRRKQEEEKKKGLLDPESGFRTTLAIGTEVGLNTILDLFSVDPTQVSQVLGAQAINYLAQRIRGGEFSQGEMVASGLASLIPGGAQAKSLGGVIGKTALRGGVSGAIETGAADLIDTGKIDAGNVVAGGAIGTTFGGLFGTAIGMNPTKVANTVARIKSRARGGDFIPLDSGIIEGVGTVGAAQINPKGSKFAQQTLKGMSDEELAPYTLKFRPQPWEKSPENLLEQSTGIPQKLEQPLPYGQKYTLIPDKERGRPLRQIVKEDIDLSSPKYKIGKDPIDKVVRNFRRRIIGLMQIDRIRSEDVGTKVGFSRTSTNINKYTEGTSEISNTYFDYLTGYFNRFIRPGKVRNFDGAVNLIAPKVGFPDQITTVKGNPALIRELRLFTIAPDVYGSGAFKTSDKTYQAKLKSIIRRISLADEAGDFKLWDKRSQTFKYKVDAHHVDQIDEGWPLYEGLPKEEIPKMRKLVQAYGLEPGNHSDNAKLLIKQDHVKYHAKYWPEARKNLETTGEGWPTLNEAARLKLLRIKTAIGREDYVKRYVKEVMESQKQVDIDVRNRLQMLADKKNKTIEQLTTKDIESLDIEIDKIDPSDPLDRSVKAPKDIQKDIDEG